MAKQTYKVTESHKITFAEFKEGAKSGKYKARLSFCPFRDGQKISKQVPELFEENWESGEEKGIMTAFGFKELKEHMSIRMFGKSVIGRLDTDRSKPEILIENKGGLAEIMGKHSFFDDECWKDIQAFFKEDRTITLTRYFKEEMNPFKGVLELQQRTLVNII